MECSIFDNIKIFVYNINYNILFHTEVEYNGHPIVFKMLLEEGMISEELVCEPCEDYVTWQDDVPEIEVG
jgi:hypothetical protein